MSWGGYIEHRNGDKSKVHCCTDGDYHYYCTAVSSTYVMTSGVHYAEFQITGEPYIGIVRPMPSLDAGAYHTVGEFFFIGDNSFYPDFLAQRSDDWGDNVHACDYNCGDGKMGCTKWADEEDDVNFENWEGMESCQSGDTVGMLLNLDEGTLTVHKNNRRLGVMEDGLSGPYCWYVSIRGPSGSVAIKRGAPPSSDGAATT